MGSLLPAGNKDEDKYDNRLILLIRDFKIQRRDGDEKVA